MTQNLGDKRLFQYIRLADLIKTLHKFNSL